MSRFLFGQSYYLRFDPKLWAARQPYPPLGTLYACACLRARGHDVALFDAMLASSESEWSTALDREKPQFAVLFEDNFNYLSKMCLLRMRRAALAMIEAARARRCTVIVAGSDATDHPDIYLAAGAQFVIIGEGERTLEELVDTLTGRSTVSLDRIAGLAYAGGLGEPGVVRTMARPDIVDLDALPPAAWDLVDAARYRSVWRRAHGRFSLNLVTTRGCPYRCNWCAKPIWGQRYNAHSPARVVDDLIAARDALGAGHVWFADDILGLKPGWLPQFADLLEARNVRVPFKCQTRADLLLREGEVEALRRAGAEMVWLGAESGSQRVLDAMEKGTTVAQIEQATRRLQQAGIGVGFFLQFGYPEETRDDIELTLDLVRRCEPDDIGISVAYPLPGTRFFDRVRHELGTVDHWEDSDDLAMLYRGPYSTGFYRRLHTVLHREFRARRAWRALRRTSPGPAGVRKGPASAGMRFAGDLRSLVSNTVGLPVDRWRLERLARHDERTASRSGARGAVRTLESTAPQDAGGPA